MNPEQYTDEQKADISERVEKARNLLKELSLQPACMPQMQNTGDDVFGIKLIPYLQDVRYSPKKSPLQAEDI